MKRTGWEFISLMALNDVMSTCFSFRGSSTPAIGQQGEVERLTWLQDGTVVSLTKIRGQWDCCKEHVRFLFFKVFFISLRQVYYCMSILETEFLYP
jgi:hypothetical protein